MTVGTEMHGMEVNIDIYGGSCDCGAEHNLLTKAVMLGRGATRTLGGVAKALGLTSGGCVICDTNTERYANLAAMEAVRYLNPGTPAVSLDANGLRADERSTSALEKILPEDTQWLIAAGSGTIHDITRFIACKRGIPFISYPTAASADAFASPVCAITINGYKTTAKGVAPVAVIADTDVFSQAPYRLTASGIGCVFGKYTALADWKLGRLLSDEALCEKIYLMVESAVEDVRVNLPAIHAMEHGAMEKLMRALIFSGIAAQLWEGSRPVSGGERHLAYFWEMGIINNKPEAFYGETVGVGLLTALRQCEKLLWINNAEEAIEPYTGMPVDLMRKRFGIYYDDVARESRSDPLKTLTPDKLAPLFPEIKSILAKVPKAGRLRPLMKAAGCLTTLEEIGLDKLVVPESVVLSPFVSKKITFVRLLRLFKP